MANVNVNRSVQDAFYRYKMPRIIAKVEGKGNGIKTVIVNMTDVAKALSRPPTYPTKYFGCELGAQTQFDNKNDRFIVNGSHDSGKLQDLLDGFIKRFVLCQECDNPETNLTVLQKKNMILQRCIACGHQRNVDMRHKLTTYILKNPPDQDPVPTTPAGKKNKKPKRGGKDEDVNGDTKDAGTKTSSRSSHQEEDDDEDWGDDTSDAAVMQRRSDLSGAIRDMTISDDLDKTPQQRVDMFYAFVKDKKESNAVTGAEQEKEIVSEAKRLDIKDKAPLVLVELLYDENILEQITKYRTLFLRLTTTNTKAQKYLLGGLEQLVGVVYPSTLMSKVLRILQKFYDCDILAEETLLEWDKKASKKYVSKEISKEIHAKAAPFISWLKEAEEESSGEEEEEEEEDVEVVYSHTEKVGTHTIPKEAPKDGSNAAEEDDDFDIDAI